MKTLRKRIEGIVFDPLMPMDEQLDAILEAVREEEQELIGYFESELLKRLEEGK